MMYTCVCTHPSLLRLLRLGRQHVGDVLRVFPRESNVPDMHWSAIPNLSLTYVCAEKLTWYGFPSPRALPARS